RVAHDLAAARVQLRRRPQGEERVPRLGRGRRRRRRASPRDRRARARPRPPDAGDDDGGRVARRGAGPPGGVVGADRARVLRGAPVRDGADLALRDRRRVPRARRRLPRRLARERAGGGMNAVVATAERRRLGYPSGWWAMLLLIA